MIDAGLKEIVDSLEDEVEIVSCDESESFAWSSSLSEGSTESEGEGEWEEEDDSDSGEWEEEEGEIVAQTFDDEKLEECDYDDWDDAEYNAVVLDTGMDTVKVHLVIISLSFNTFGMLEQSVCLCNYPSSEFE